MMYTCDISKNLKDDIARLYIYRRWGNDLFYYYSRKKNYFKYIIKL